MIEQPGRRLRILLSAYAFAPNQGSEAGVGWNVATRLAKYHDVTVLCGDLGGNGRTLVGLQNYFNAHGPIPGLEYCYVAPSGLTRVVHWIHARPGLWFVYYAAYRMWQQEAYRKAIELHAQQPFDAAHLLTFASYRDPGFLWRLPIPFFWGPIAGAGSPPPGLLLLGGVRFVVRYLGNLLQRRFSGRPRAAARRAALTWVVSNDERQLVEKWGGCAQQQFEVGTTTTDTLPHTLKKGETLRMVWSGNHTPGKGLPLALASIARVPDTVPIHLEIIGSGPMTAACKKLSIRLKVEHKVTWHGRVEHARALSLMANCHALLHTSLSEATSTVLLEALARGLPVICHDANGMHFAINNGCGIKIPMLTRQTSVHGFYDAILRLADPDTYNPLSVGALERAEELTWDRKVETIARAYSVLVETSHV